MKVIDLLNKIAKGEEVPERIKFENYIYIWRNYEKDYFCKQINHSLESIIGEYMFSNLNLEIEIIEEEKEIEEITIRDNTLGFPNGEWTARNMDKAFAYKINELVREVNKLKKNKE